MNIIGRQEECEMLTKALKSSEAEFIAVYGRRRVGKTFLIREFFNKLFKHSALKGKFLVLALGDLFLKKEVVNKVRKLIYCLIVMTVLLTSVKSSILINRI